MPYYDKNTASVTPCVLDYLEGRDFWTHVSEIHDIILSLTGIKDHATIKIILTSLVMSGKLRGDSYSPRKTTRYKIKKAASSDQIQSQPSSPPIEKFIKRIENLNNQLAEAQAVQPEDKVVQVQLLEGDKVVSSFEDLFHASFEAILQLAEARMNVFIYGPTGCGKSHICSQVAKALGLPFYFISCTAGMSEGIMGGRLLPTGDAGKFEYTVSEFVKAYENGGVFLLDEIDAADPNVLLLINAALANGKMSVPNRTEKPYAIRHKDFICVAAANTVGTGADRLYSGRNKLDAATLDRFQIGKVFMDYSADVEVQLCPDDELRSNLLKYRKAINENRLERAMSTRFMRDAYKMKTDFGWDQTQIDLAFFSGWREDEVAKVKNH